MSGMKKDLMWSPNHPNRFITFGNDLHLYEVEELKDGNIKPSAISISESSVANLLSTNSDNQYMKCVSWYPKPQYDHLLAVGLANGKVVLNSFEDNANNLELVGREFIPKHSRCCNCVSWNPVESNLLASGLEKTRTDHGILIWDVTKPLYAAAAIDTIANFDKRPTSSNVFSVDTSNITRPVVELGMSEATQSLHWFPHTPQIIVCGMNNKHIKIYDLRDPSKHQNSTTSKAVYGVCVDPYFEHRLASFYENLFVLWDVRNFEKPLVTLTESKNILKIGWCPTRCSLLGALIKDTPTVKLYDIQSSMGNDEVEPTIVERNVQPFVTQSIISFAWHPTQENRMLTIAQTGTILDYTVFDRITLNWSPTSEIVWTYGRKVLQCVDSRDKFYDYLSDISVKMRRRAGINYGLNLPQVWTNVGLSDNKHLHGVWIWLDLVKKGRLKKALTYEGVQTIVCGENGTSTLSHSEPYRMSWINFNSGGSKVLKFTSEERERALQLCGWGSEVDSTSLTSFVEGLEADGNYTRAAVISVFNLDIRRAILLLNKGASALSKTNLGNSENHRGCTDLNAIAMALAGYTEDRSALWREINSNLKSKLTDPHLRAMFAFLTAEGDNYDEILNETGIAIQDRMAFACIYLPDRKLADFLEKLKTRMSEVGNLDGILLTGLTNDGLSLIQRYVDTTGDIQTASLIILHTLPSNVSQDPRAQEWVENYRHLLDVWRLWKQRAMFDCQWFKASSVDSKPSQQVFVSCSFCRRSVSNYLQLSYLPPHSARFSQLAATSAQKTKMSCCPGCRKPLPRCSLCLSHMGTPAGMHWRRPLDEKTDKKKLTEFSSWLTWCQTCRHGGHSVHILGWFEEHAECPVTGCTCKCQSLDAVAKLGSMKNEAS